MKKKYIKPSMDACKLPERQLILCYSGGGLGAPRVTSPVLFEDELGDELQMDLEK